MSDCPRVYSELLVKKTSGRGWEGGGGFHPFFKEEIREGAMPSLFIIRDNYIL